MQLFPFIATRICFARLKCLSSQTGTSCNTSNILTYGVSSIKNSHVPGQEGGKEADCFQMLSGSSYLSLFHGAQSTPTFLCSFSQPSKQPLPNLSSTCISAAPAERLDEEGAHPPAEQNCSPGRPPSSLHMLKAAPVVPPALKAPTFMSPWPSLAHSFGLQQTRYAGFDGQKQPENTKVSLRNFRLFPKL